MDGQRYDPVSTRATIASLAKNHVFLLNALSVAANSAVVYGIIQWVPMFLMRSHGLTLARVGPLFGTVYGVGMCSGMVLGGLMGDRLARRSDSAPVYGSAVVALIGCPIFLAAFLASSLNLAMCCLFLGSLVLAMSIPPTQYIFHMVTASNIRGTAAATNSLIVGLVGLGTGPTIVGLASDYLAPAFGNEALRFALCLLMSLNILAVSLFLATGVGVARRGHRTEAVGVVA
jgi:MFS family permease